LVAFAALLVAPTPALALPEGRVYEQVSPVYKAGYAGENEVAVEPDGNSVIFPSHGGFAGLLNAGANASNWYVARRGESGWSTTSVNPPFGTWADVSANLEYALGTGPLGPNAGYDNGAATEQVFQVHPTSAPETAEEWSVFGGLVLTRVDGLLASAAEEGGSPDLCHIILESPPLLAETDIPQIYDFSQGCNGESPSLRLVGLNNQPTPTPISHCRAELGSGVEYHKIDAALESNFDAIAAGGSDIFFTTSVEAGGNCGGLHQVFARLGGSRTLEVSKPLAEAEACGGEVPCKGAAKRASSDFVGASEDGSRVFFMTTAPLSAEDKNAGIDLYMATIGCPVGVPECEQAAREVTSLTLVSHNPNPGQAAELEGVVKISRDGSRTYFVARSVLGEGANAQGQLPLHGADNFYVYDALSGKVAFLADLCSGPGMSGGVEDASCPSDLESGGGSRNDTRLRNGNPEAQTNSCPLASPGCEAGRFLVFSSFGQLARGDTDSAKDVYRYDAVTGVLERVSVGEHGADANGNDNAFDATIALGHVGSTNSVYTQYELGARAITEDGSRIVFSTAAPLSETATNGLTNVYEWHERAVSLISSGNAVEPDVQPVISASGRDIFFNTAQGLVSQDTDGVRDVYDARLGGGFAPMPSPRARCEGDGCQGPLTNPAPLLVPGSVSQAPGGNFPSAGPASSFTPRRTIKCSKGKRLSHGKCVKTKAQAKKGNARSRKTSGTWSAGR
jgi:hypothetical protein